MMFGVVLWSDGRDDRAVIWCEDHGDLAYFNASEDLDGPGLGLDPGDLVQFEVKECGAVRRVLNPRVVAEEQYPSLAHRLRTIGQPGDADQDGAASAGHGARTSRAIVVPFPARHAAQDVRDRHEAGPGYVNAR